MGHAGTNLHTTWTRTCKIIVLISCKYTCTSLGYFDLSVIYNYRINMGQSGKKP